MHTLSYRKMLRIDGNTDEILPYLQGILSNDVNSLMNCSAAYGLLLTPQGKIISDVFLYKQKGSILLDVMSSNYDSIFTKMQMYAVGRQVELTNSPLLVNVSTKSDDDDAYQDLRVSSFGRSLTTTKHKDEAIYSQYRSHLIRNLIPEFDDATLSEKFFPLDFAMDQIANSVNYEKGCYVGQEVTARSKYRGVKRKQLCNVEVPSANDKIVNIAGSNTLVLQRIVKQPA